MHEINWKWQNGVGKMLTGVETKAAAQRARERALCPGWWPRLVYLETG